MRPWPAGQHVGGHRGLQRRHRPQAGLDDRLPEAGRDLPPARGVRDGAPGLPPRGRSRPVGDPTARGARRRLPRGNATPVAAARYQEYVKLDNRAPRVLYKLAFARYNDGHAAEAIDALASGRARRPVRGGLLPPRSLPARRAAPGRSARRAGASGRDSAHAAARARGAGRSVRRARTHRQPAHAARGALGTRSQRVARSHARSGLRARRSEQRAILTLGRAAERYPELPLHLRRARSGVAGDRAERKRPGRVEQGARGARRGGRERRQQRGADALRAARS